LFVQARDRKEPVSATLAISESKKKGGKKGCDVMGKRGRSDVWTKKTKNKTDYL